MGMGGECKKKKVNGCPINFKPKNKRDDQNLTRNYLELHNIGFSWELKNKPEDAQLEKLFEGQKYFITLKKSLKHGSTNSK